MSKSFFGAFWVNKNRIRKEYDYLQFVHGAEEVKDRKRSTRNRIIAFKILFVTNRFNIHPNCLFLFAKQRGCQKVR